MTVPICDIKQSSDVIKFIISFSLLLFSIAVICCGVVLRYNVPDFGHVFVEFCVLLLALTVLFLNEGFQVGAIRLSDVDINVQSEESRKRFPRCFEIWNLLYRGNEGDNKMKALFIGQSFLVVFCTFMISQITTFPNFFSRDQEEMNPSGATVVESFLVTFFFRSGLPGVFFTVTMAQLLPSILAKQFPRQFLNTVGVNYLIRFALLIEAAGVLEFLYVLVSLVERSCCGRSSVTNNTCVATTDSMNTCAQGAEEEPSSLKKAFSWCKVTLSAVLTGASVTFIVIAIGRGYSTFNAPIIIQYVLLGVAMAVIFYCEGLKIAIVSTVGSDSFSNGVGEDEEVLEAPLPPHTVPCSSMEAENTTTATAATNALLMSPTSDLHSRTRSRIAQLLLANPQGVERFLLGRQQMCVPLAFVIAQLTHFGGLSQAQCANSAFLYAVVVQIGLPGIIVLLQFAQLLPQLLAQTHPEAFLSLPGAYTLVYFALAVEKLGITCVSSIALDVVSGGCCGAEQPFSTTVATAADEEQPSEVK